MSLDGYKRITPEPHDYRILNMLPTLCDLVAEAIENKNYAQARHWARGAYELLARETLLSKRDLKATEFNFPANVRDDLYSVQLAIKATASPAVLAHLEKMQAEIIAKASNAFMGTAYAYLEPESEPEADLPKLDLSPISES